MKMAWIFSLSAECGSDESDAHKFAQHFEGMSWLLSNGRHCECRTDIFQDIEENWWCRVSPNNLSEVGIDSPESAYLMTELGILLYQSLQFAPNFRYALVGVEVDEFRTYSELIEESSNLSISGLVLAKSLERELGILPVFRSFGSGYVWQPYAGEVYNPLMASPSLKNKLNELLAVS
jgi:hypothetical protein